MTEENYTETMKRPFLINTLEFNGLTKGLKMLMKYSVRKKLEEEGLHAMEDKRR
jgi:hypothetical protein